MNELKELSRKVKENTTVKKEEKKNEPEIKNLFENLLSNNSINYLSSFINKTNVIDKPGENGAEEGTSHRRDHFENARQSGEKPAYGEPTAEEGTYPQDNAPHGKKHLAEKKKKYTDDSGHTTDSKNVSHINVKKILQNKKNVDLKDLNKLINFFNDEIMERSKKLERFINKNKIKNDYSEQILMIEKFNREIRIIEKKFSQKDPLYQIYLIKKEKKKSFDSLVFFKNFFKCLNNYLHLLDKAETNYKKLKIWKVLLYLRNCKTHILLIRAIFKSARGGNVNGKDIQVKGAQVNIEEGNTSDDHPHLDEATPLEKSNEDEKVKDMQGNDTTCDEFRRDNHLDKKLMEDLKKIFLTDLHEQTENEKPTFMKEVKMKYDHLLSNLRCIVQVTFEKMFLFNGNIKIYKHIYLNGGEIFSENGENIQGQKISYVMFWHLAYILKMHRKYLEEIKKHLFFNLFKFMVLFYCLAKNMNWKKVINNLHKMQHASYSLNYQNVKNFVSSVVQKNNVDLYTPYCCNHFGKFKRFLFSEHDGRASGGEEDSEGGNDTFTSLSLSDYIIEHEDSVLINMEDFFSHFLGSLEGDNNISQSCSLTLEESSPFQREDVDLEEAHNLESDEAKGKQGAHNRDATVEREKGTGSANFFAAMSRCLFEFNALAELLFVEDRKNGRGRDRGGNVDERGRTDKTDDALPFDIMIEEGARAGELKDAFDFYFGSQKGEENGETYFLEYELEVHEEGRLNKMKEKIRNKYERSKCEENRGEHVERGNASEPPNGRASFSHYMLNRELNENLFTYFHKINRKRNNFNNIFDVYFMYRWKKEEKKFDQLIQKIFQKNFHHYLEQTYSILREMLLFKKQGEYILVDSAVDDYLYNIFFDEDNNYSLKNVDGVTYRSFVQFVEEGQNTLKKALQEKIDKIIEQKNMHSRGVAGGGTYCAQEATCEEFRGGGIFKEGLPPYGDANQTVLSEKEEKDTPGVGCQVGHVGNEQEKEDKCIQEGEEGIGASPTMEKAILRVTAQEDRIDCMRIHKNLLYIVFVVYRIVHFSYEILLDMKGEKWKHHLAHKIEEEKKEKKQEQKRKEIVAINIVLFCYKIVKYIYDAFLSYCFFSFRFSCFPKLPCENEFLLSVINDNIFLKKVLQNVYSVFLHHQNLFNLSMCSEDIISFKNMDFKRDGDFCRRRSNEWENGQRIKGDHNIRSEEKDRRECNLKKEKLQADEYFPQWNGEKKKSTCPPKEYFHCINKMSILNKIHLYIDKFHINLNFFKNMFVKIYKDKFRCLLQKGTLFTEEQFLINISKIVNIIFDFFQIQDLCKIAHTDITLRLVDYFFSLINAHVYMFMKDGGRIDEDVRQLLYKKFIFTQNSLSFLLHSYGDNCWEQKNRAQQEENYFLRITDELPFSLINLKKNKTLFLLLFCKVKHILNAKKGILEMHDPKIVQALLASNPYAYEDENYDAILNEFK
ncbi:conserved Plasmodium protein, unknown function [Plasmodium knowlesi strain H]|uniref:Uncharacterized protein n=3 Tax=Plasmodium knowlesi TaxID=5850 RepID=A0A5K1UR36_PLAKH|nr:conserved Plasmodium protein, unknown function [Plasmodium knowlesi strain H]OTN64639.1 Uncharacterized protein PKNOH_S130179400 [Plasmodium knowlesi]CAA9988962.1 conserved Plasmodium protein, unknown function [Plasmodium knowlesi strain H]SBO24806.1 conserved Plasmodium protein, unknown function [Plasmodium knowlesi strain H]SBO28069.1 conserved Plasmodium protein, unknown function [Plasmodium knowlesi strain H]VVS78436.1 conserved Plasmodium protein, unknown function [Plasmodium knowlesi |eukprot:XP_002261310.1 hypothetical protein, conserved in Plasmodium species [Plasmodium knowlesi strain H]